MKILLVTQFFHPENFKSNDIAFELAGRGHKVTVLTGIPNYPKGRFHNGYGLFCRRREMVGGVRIIRTLVVPRGKGGGLMLALNYLSWAFFASVRAFFMALSHRYDAVIVHQTSPLTQGFPALVVKCMRGTPIYFWVLDLWPESLRAAGGIGNPLILDFFGRIAGLMYRRSDWILISSKGFSESICAKGRFEDKLVYFPNWAEDACGNATDGNVPELPKGFKVMFAGNVGEAQDMPAVMSAAELLKGKGIVLIIVGDGRKMEWVRDYVLRHDLSDVVYLAGAHPSGEMPSYFRQADVLFLSLRDDYIFRLTAPARLQAYMAAGKPVIAMADGETADLVEEAACGYACAAGDYRAFADCVLRMKSLPEDERVRMGMDGRDFFFKKFRKDRCIDHLCAILPEI